MSKRAIPPSVACPGCGSRMRQHGEWWMCGNRDTCHMAVLACPDCQRPMQHLPGGRARCSHCQTEWVQAQGGAA